MNQSLTQLGGAPNHSPVRSEIVLHNIDLEFMYI